MQTVLFAAAATGLATGLGVLPFLFVKRLHRRFYDGVLGVGAGLMLAAATLGLLAEALEGVRSDDGALDAARLGIVVAGFVAGVVIAALMDKLIPHHHAGGHHEHLSPRPADVHVHAHTHTHAGAHAHGHSEVHAEAHAPASAADLRHVYSVVGALSLHRLPEGIAIGAGFSSHIGWLLTLAVSLQNACEGVVMAAPMLQAGLSRTRTFLLVVLTGLTVPVGALIGVLLSGVAETALPFVLAMAGGTLIYVTSNEVIPESHSHGHEGTASAGVVAGFLVTMVLGAVLHH